MPISATGNKRLTLYGLFAEHGFTLRGRSAEHGFTLVELMVVVAIVGLASAAVVVALPDPRGRIVDEADRFAMRAKAVQDDAIVQGRVMRLRIDASGYAVEQRGQGRWQAATGRPFSPVSWKPGTTVSSGGSAVFDPTGAIAEPITIDLRRDAAAVRVTLTSDGGIRVGRD